MAKKVTGYIKLQIPAGKATPAHPVIHCRDTSFQKDIYLVYRCSFLYEGRPLRHPYYLHASCHALRCMSKVTVQVISLFRIQFSNDFICFTHFSLIYPFPLLFLLYLYHISHRQERTNVLSSFFFLPFVTFRIFL